MLLSMIVFGAVTAGAMACRDQHAAMALLVVSGISMVTAFSTLNSLVQENAPDALKGRILSIYGLAFRGGLPLGALLAGVLVRPFGAPLVIGAFSVMVATLAAITLFANERIRAL
jgi:MFS-type transporter involved in bile tolerance (Atg22 family)